MPQCGFSQIYTTQSTNSDTRRDTTCRRCGERITFTIQGVVAKARRGGRPRSVVSSVLPPETTHDEAIAKATMQNVPLDLRDQAGEIMKKAQFEVAALWNKKVEDYL